ncbi:LLM class F420-dependent oxidoreductase [Streptomyces sp. NPDC087300]|uniref:LLM class F420-dependent oxidoreductase n=1 Tax=Streptomyces sp. NPDC087300 TaxID=3365780 RepID=UPI003808EF32
MTPALSATPGYWQDRPPAEWAPMVEAVERLGYGELWLGEMATYDVFALATAVAARTAHIPLTLGPLAVGVRDPVSIARGVASVAELTGRRVDVALGTASPVVVGEWHGRQRARSATVLRESATALRGLLDGGKAFFEGETVRTRGYRLRLPPPRSALSVAAFGPAAVRTAALHADRMVLNLITPASAAKLVRAMRAAAADGGRRAPRVAVWATAAVGPSPAAVEQLRRGVVGYLAAPGYGEMFTEAGFGDLVAFARTRPHPRELLKAVPAAAVGAVGLVGDPGAVRARLAEYAAAGVDEIVVVPASTDDDPGGVRTLTAVMSLT